MPQPESSAGWAWLDPTEQAGNANDTVCRDAAGCFDGRHGRNLLVHLRQRFLDRRLPPTASDAGLRHVEGQRSVVAHILQLIERGRLDPATAPSPLPSFGELP